MVFLCNMFYQGFSVIFFAVKDDIFIIKKFYNTHQVKCYHFFIDNTIVKVLI